MDRQAPGVGGSGGAGGAQRGAACHPRAGQPLCCCSSWPWPRGWPRGPPAL